MTATSLPSNPGLSTLRGPHAFLDEQEVLLLSDIWHLVSRIHHDLSPGAAPTDRPGRALRGVSTIVQTHTWLRSDHIHQS